MIEGNFYELSSVCKDAFIVLNGAVEIHYRDGDIWRADEDEKEHPVAHRLRAASLVSLVNDPPTTVNDSDPGLPSALREERVANAAMREFLIALEDVCHARGMARTVVGHEVIKWLDKKLSIGS